GAADVGELREPARRVDGGLDRVAGARVVAEGRSLPPTLRERRDGGLEALLEHGVARLDVARPDQEERGSRDGDDEHEEPDDPEASLFTLLHVRTTSSSASWMRPLLASPDPPWTVSRPCKSVKRPPASRTRTAAAQ